MKRECHGVSHLIKNLRRNFLTKDIVFVISDKLKTAQWCHRFDFRNALRIVPRLKEDHFSLPRGEKMKVIIACQSFPIRLHMLQKSFATFVH